MLDRTIPRLTHTAQRPVCASPKPRPSGHHGPLSVNFRSTAKHRTLTELLPPCFASPWPHHEPCSNHRPPGFTLLLSYFRITIPAHLAARGQPPARTRHRPPPAHTIPQQRSNRGKGGKTIENAILFHGVFGVTAVAALLRKLVHPNPVFACLVVSIPFIGPQCGVPTQRGPHDRNTRAKVLCVSLSLE